MLEHIIIRSSFVHDFSAHTAGLDDDGLEATLHHPQHLLPLTHLHAELAVLADLLLDLHLLTTLPLLMALLPPSQDLHDLHVLG